MLWFTFAIGLTRLIYFLFPFASDYDNDKILNQRLI